MSQAHPETRPAATDPLAAFAGEQWLALLREWTRDGWLRPLDLAFAAFLHEVGSPDAERRDDLVLVAAALASSQLGRGHVCTDLEALVHLPESQLVAPTRARTPGTDQPAVAGAVTAPNPVTEPLAWLTAIPLQRWEQALCGDARVGGAAADTPLVRCGLRLYLRRLWDHEQRIRDGIRQRLALRPGWVESPRAQQVFARILAVLFPDQPQGASPALSREPASSAAPSAGAKADTAYSMDWQKLACALVAPAGFGIITGGPGTGKTTTVVRLLAALQTLQLALGATPWRIRLAAPTGKAAARLNESIAGAIASLPLTKLLSVIREAEVNGEVDARDEGDIATVSSPSTAAPGMPNPTPDSAALTATIPTLVTTLHRLLGSRPDTRHFVHDAGNRLAVDIVVVDEASMVDIELMSALLRTMPEQARLILLGDKDQLASVDAGAVLGDLCRRADGGHYRDDTLRWLQALGLPALPGALRSAAGQDLDQGIAMLRHSHRFGADSGIGHLAQAVNAGDADAVEQIWKQGGHGDIALLNLEGEPLAAALDRLDRHALHGGFARYLQVLTATRPPASAGEAELDAWAARVLEAYGSFQVLCATRKGPFGVEECNRRIAQRLFRAGHIGRPQGWYEGRPVLVTRNDYSLGLMNGDIGVTLSLPPLSTQSAESVQSLQSADSAGPAGSMHPEEPADLADPAHPAASAAGSRSVTPKRNWPSPSASGDSPSSGLEAGRLRVAFPAGDGSGGIRWVLPSRLQSVETVFAMTVHKSQGSEFLHACLVLPEQDSPVITRELLYTGITRARCWFSLVQPSSIILRDGVRRRVQRTSGLVDQLGTGQP